MPSQTLFASSKMIPSLVNITPTLLLSFRENYVLILFRAFSQLAADNQHAPLGLLLLTVLARVHALLTYILPAEEQAPTLSSIQQALPRVAPEHGSKVDKGIAVARESRENTRAESLTASSKSLGKPSRPKSAAEEKKSSKKSKKKKKDELSSLFGSLT